MFTKIHVFRIKPDEELLTGILDYCRKNDLTSGVVLGIIGSLKKARLNYVKSLPAIFLSVDYAGPLEIVAAQGSIATKDGELIAHIHTQIANEKNSCGGHLVSGIIFSTAEISIGELDYPLERYADSYTGLNELTK